MSFPRYESYKHSGVEWLGEVPEHWGVAPLKRGFQIIGGSTPKSDKETFWNGEIIWVTPADLSKLFSLYIRESQRTITAQGLASCGTTLVPKNSIILSTRAPIGSLAIAETPLCTNQGCKSLIPRGETNAKFFGYLLNISSGELNVRGKGTIFLELSSDELGAFKTPVPSPTEQQTIAAFLDRETAKIDALIAEQQRLIALLKEKRQTVISHAVTKGLNPNAPMKDSGIAWLGEVPAHWLVSPMKYHVLIRSGGTPSKQNLEYWEGDIPWASAKDLKSETLSDTIDHITSLAIESGQASLVSVDSILVVVRGMILAKTFPVSVATVPMAINQDLKAIEGRNELNSKFLVWLLRGIAKESMSRTDEAGHGTKALRMGAWISMPITIPSVNEQIAIVSFLNQETSKLDALTTEAQRGIDLLKERRSALISAAVTGKIDVRGLAVTLPESITA
jgi:type I restriction enzyme, S subunit